MPGDPGAIPRLLSGLGVAFVAVVLAEWIVSGDLQPAAIRHPTNLASLGSNLPFLVGLLYGGYWLERSDLPQERYGRIAGEVVPETVNGPGDFLLRGVPVEDPGGGEHARGDVGIYTDITERKDRERELQRHNERLQEFASVVSHDLRAPLKVAEGRLDLAGRECESDHLDAVADSYERMRALIDDLLMLARQVATVDETRRIDLARVAAAHGWSVDVTESADGGARFEVTGVEVE